MDTKKFCNDLDLELTTWAERLRHASEEFDRIPSIDKYRLTDQINGLHILLTEMQDRVCEIKRSCQIGELSRIDEAEGAVKDPQYAFKEGSGITYDYDFGG